MLYTTSVQVGATERHFLRLPGLAPDRRGSKEGDHPTIYIYILACQPGVARAFALRAELRRFAPQAPLSFLASRSLKPVMNSRKDCSSIALAALPGHSRKKPVKIGKETLRLNIIAIDHAIIRSIKRVDFELFYPTAPRNTDRPKHETCDKTARVYKKLTFSKYSCGRGF